MLFLTKLDREQFLEFAILQVIQTYFIEYLYKVKISWLENLFTCALRPDREQLLAFAPKIQEILSKFVDVTSFFSYFNWLKKVLETINNKMKQCVNEVAKAYDDLMAEAGTEKKEKAVQAVLCPLKSCTKFYEIIVRSAFEDRWVLKLTSLDTVHILFRARAMCACLKQQIDARQDLLSLTEDKTNIQTLFHISSAHALSLQIIANVNILFKTNISPN